MCCKLFSCCSPFSVNRSDIKMYFHTSPKNPIKIDLRSSDFKINPQYPVKILIHGWMDDKSSYWYEPAVNAYLKKGDVNIITVDWGKYSKGLFGKAVKAVKGVGEHVADLIKEIAEQFGVPYQNFHLAGHSLGSHISGFAGKKIIKTQGTKIGRITGLDPAGPSFEGNGPDDRLCSTDAYFVDIIHTDGGVLGYEKSLGHVDFFPNGGKRKQNGCTSMDMACSHKRAPIYFAESVNSTNFVAVQAPSYTDFDCGRYSSNQRAVMGEYVDPSIRGDFYLHTNKEAPFARGPI